MARLPRTAIQFITDTMINVMKWRIFVLHQAIQERDQGRIKRSIKAKHD